MKLIFLLAAVYLEIRICNKTSIFLFWDATQRISWIRSLIGTNLTIIKSMPVCLTKEVWNEQAALPQPLLISGSAYCDQAFPLKEFRPGQTFCKQVGGCRSFSSPPSNLSGSHTTNHHTHIHHPHTNPGGCSSPRTAPQIRPRRCLEIISPRLDCVWLFVCLLASQLD